VITTSLDELAARAAALADELAVGRDGAPGPAGAAGADGRDGKDVDLEEVADLIDEALVNQRGRMAAQRFEWRGCAVRFERSSGDWGQWVDMRESFEWRCFVDTAAEAGITARESGRELRSLCLSLFLRVR
jgi:hypothetical protein